MNTRTCLILLTAGLALAGCAKHRMSQGPMDERQMHEWMIKSYADGAVQNAILSQQTLYNYHFEQDSSELNQLGRRDLDILANHYRRTPGTLHVIRGPASEGVYTQRIESVRRSLERAGVPADAVETTGDYKNIAGATARRVTIVLDRADKATSTSSTSTSSSNGSVEQGRAQ